MPNGGYGYGRQPGEYTKTGIDTEITIPWKTYKILGLVGNLSILGFFVVGWCVWLMTAKYGAWDWFLNDWVPWVSRWWPLIIICLVLWWAAPVSSVTIYRFTVEQMFKNLPPTYQSQELENGPWPFRKRRPGRYEQFYGERRN